MKISEVTKAYLKEYLRIDYDDEDNLIDALMIGAKTYITGYTGLTSEEIDLKPDLTIAYQVLISDMYTQRQYTVDKDSVNKVVDTILSMHCVNLL